MSAVTTTARPPRERAIEALQRGGNPFRNYFARNPDDEVCARYHVPELFAPERELLLSVVDLYRYDPMTHSEVVPVLGNKGAGKTHLLYSIKHGDDGTWQLLVTPGVYQRDTEFLEYLLFQIIDTLLGGGKQKNVRPLEYVGDKLVRRLLDAAVRGLSAEERVESFPPPGLGKWARRFGLGQGQAQERSEWLLEQLSSFGGSRPGMPIRQALAEAGLSSEQALEMIESHVARTEAHNASGLMRRSIYLGFARAVLLGEESTLAGFLTYGFAELEFHVRPSRQDLVLSLFKVLMEVFRSLKTPVVVAFDQLEDLLLSRRSDDAHRIAEAFFAGVVQVMHQVDGLCFLIFAERGLWNRFVPSLDGYIQDRLNNPVHVPKHGTIKALRLEAPDPELVRCVVEARLRGAAGEPAAGEVGDIFPFDDEQVIRIARTEPTLRDMLQQFRHLFDHVVYGSESAAEPREPANRIAAEVPPAEPIAEAVRVKSVEVVESAEVPPALPVAEVAPEPVPASSLGETAMAEMWQQEQRAAKRKLEPEGSLTGATRELQAGLGQFLQACHEHGVKVGPWRLQHVVAEYNFGDHPTYGTISIAHWACKDGQPWKVGIGLFLARGAGKPRDLDTKLKVMKVEPAVIDHLILMRPEDDLSLTGKSKGLWQDAEKQGHHARLEPVALDGFAQMYSFPRWLTALTEELPDGQPLPNLADLIQEQCEALLEQVCMPIH